MNEYEHRYKKSDFKAKLLQLGYADISDYEFMLQDAEIEVETPIPYTLGTYKEGMLDHFEICMQYITEAILKELGCPEECAEYAEWYAFPEVNKFRYIFHFYEPRHDGDLIILQSHYSQKSFNR